MIDRIPRTTTDPNRKARTFSKLAERAGVPVEVLAVDCVGDRGVVTVSPIGTLEPHVWYRLLNIGSGLGLQVQLLRAAG